MTTTARATTIRIVTSATRPTRTRASHHMSVTRRHAVIDAYIARVNGGLITAAAYLREVLGAGEAFTDRFGSSFGTKVSKAYQAAIGRKSNRTGLARRGYRIFDAFAYTTGEKRILDQAARGYDKTAPLIAA